MENWKLTSSQISQIEFQMRFLKVTKNLPISAWLCATQWLKPISIHSITNFFLKFLPEWHCTVSSKCQPCFAVFCSACNKPQAQSAAFSLFICKTRNNWTVKIASKKALNGHFKVKIKTISWAVPLFVPLSQRGGVSPPHAPSPWRRLAPLLDPPLATLKTHWICSSIGRCQCVCLSVCPCVCVREGISRPTWIFGRRLCSLCAVVLSSVSERCHVSWSLAELLVSLFRTLLRTTMPVWSVPLHCVFISRYAYLLTCCF